jgi:urea transport system permease protein
MLLAFVLGWFMFRGRITGVFVAIITLAMLVVINLIIIDQQKYTGGFNGITDLSTFTAFGISFDAYSTSTYYLVAGTLCVVLLGGLAITRTKLGLILQAIRDDENRVRYFGYDVAAYQNFAFTLSAGVAGFAGMLYTLMMEFASPTFLSVPLSLSIVIWCAVGGRASLLGAAIGAVLVTGVQGNLSESPTFLDTWMLIMGAIFIIVVLFLPNGLISLAEKAKRLMKRKAAGKETLPSVADAAIATFDSKRVREG